MFLPAGRMSLPALPLPASPLSDHGHWLSRQHPSAWVTVPAPSLQGNPGLVQWEHEQQDVPFPVLLPFVSPEPSAGAGAAPAPSLPRGRGMVMGLMMD